MRIASAILAAFVDKAAAFRADTRGAIVVLYATVGILLIGFLALAVDGARAHILRSQLHYAVDAAAIAIGKQMKSLTDEELMALAQKFIRANVSPSLLGLTGDFGEGDLTILLFDGPNENLKEIRATAKMRTAMLGMVDGASSVDIQKSAMVRREIRAVELALALDVTGSMAWASGTPGVSRIEALKASANAMLNIIFENKTVHPKVWVSIVPFTQAVQARTNVNWVKATTLIPPLPIPDSDEIFVWGVIPDLLNADPFCYGKRSTTADAEGDTPPSSDSKKFGAAYEYAYVYKGKIGSKKKYEVSVTPGYLCPLATILPLTNVKADVVTRINSLIPHGGTATDRGAVWGWRAISQNWRGYWNVSDPAHPFDNDAPLNDKILVLMTDGENSYASSSDPALTRICNNIKAQGIKIIAINFAMPESLYPLYRNCASSPDLFFPATDADQLANTFEAIALQLSVLRLVE